jgi:hypothetical protein
VSGRAASDRSPSVNPQTSSGVPSCGRRRGKRRRPYRAVRTGGRSVAAEAPATSVMSRNRAVIAWLIIAAGSVLLVAWIARVAASPTPTAGPPQPAADSHSTPPTLAPSLSPSPAPSPKPSASSGRHPRRSRHSSPPAAVPVATASAPPAAPSCYPRNGDGDCYEPGDFCWRAGDGATGIAGDGRRIRCERNDGWRWEPI